jgi:hypothetical protein
MACRRAASQLHPFQGALNWRMAYMLR